jgi:hypothetical protein
VAGEAEKLASFTKGDEAGKGMLGESDFRSGSPTVTGILFDPFYLSGLTDRQFTGRERRCRFLRRWLP